MDIQRHKRIVRKHHGGFLDQGDHTSVFSNVRRSRDIMRGVMLGYPVTLEHHRTIMLGVIGEENMLGYPATLGDHKSLSIFLMRGIMG